MHTSSQLLQHLACQVPAFVKLPWQSWQGWHHAFAAKLRCYCSHAHCLGEAQTLCAFGTLSKQYACQVSAPGKLPCLSPIFMRSNRAKASSSPTRCPKHSLIGHENRQISSTCPEQHACQAAAPTMPQNRWAPHPSKTHTVAETLVLAVSPTEASQVGLPKIRHLSHALLNMHTKSQHL